MAVAESRGRRVKTTGSSLHRMTSLCQVLWLLMLRPGTDRVHDQYHPCRPVENRCRLDDIVANGIREDPVYEFLHVTS